VDGRELSMPELESVFFRLKGELCVGWFWERVGKDDYDISTDLLLWSSPTRINVLSLHTTFYTKVRQSKGGMLASTNHTTSRTMAGMNDESMLCTQGAWG